MNDEWPRVSLGELIRLQRRPAEVIADHTYQEIGIYSYGRGIFHKTPRSGLEVGDKDLFVVKQGDLILQITFAWEGAIALCSAAEDGLYGSVRFPTYRVNEERCFAPFLSRYLCTPEGLDQIGRICPGSAGRNRVLALKRLPEIKIPLPPIAKQRHIVAQLQIFEEKIAEARQLRNLVQLEVKALSASLLSAMLPKQATVKRLQELVAEGSKISYGVLVPGPDTTDGVPFVRVQDLSIASAAALPNKKITASVDAQYSRTRLMGGEVLIGVVGSIGKIGIAPASWKGANIARAVCRVMPGPGVDARYLAEFLSERTTQQFFAASTRTLAQPTLNVSLLANTPIKLPSIDEQRRIVSELDVVQERASAIKALQMETAAQLSALFPSVLDKAFRGQL